MIEKLFVYGTLAPGRPNEHILSGLSGRWESATVRGDLVPEGWGAAAGFPGLVLDEHGHEVDGFLFSSEDLRQHWRRLDDFEGEGYQRVLDSARLRTGEVVEANIYVLRRSRDGDAAAGTPSSGLDVVIPTSTPVAVTGVSGFVGGRVARLLDGAGIPQRLLARDPAGPAIPRLATVTDTRRAPYGDTDAALRALDGVRLLFMVSASESADRLEQHLTFVDAAAQAGVEHVVYTSFLGAAPDATFTLARTHYATEERIKASGMRWTMLRDCFYLDFLPGLAGQDGVIRGPAADGLVGAVAREDVARVAAAVLADPRAHQNVTYDLTGRQALSLTEVAQVITQVTGRPTTYHPETVDEAYASRAHFGAPGWQLDAWVSTYTAIANGELAAISPAVSDITGRPPLTLAEYLRL